MSTNTLPPPAAFNVELSDVQPGTIIFTVQHDGITLHMALDTERAALLGATLSMASLTALLAEAQVELAKREQPCR